MSDSRTAAARQYERRLVGGRRHLISSPGIHLVFFSPSDSVFLLRFEMSVRLGSGDRGRWLAGAVRVLLEVQLLRHPHYVGEVQYVNKVDGLPVVRKRHVAIKFLVEKASSAVHGKSC